MKGNSFFSYQTNASGMSETSINSSLSNSLQSIDGQNITSAIRNILVINCVVNIPLALTSFVGNTLVLYGVWKTPTLRSPSIILLCGLALSDLAVGIVAQPLFIVNNLLRVYSQSQNVKDVFSSVYNTFGYTLCGISLCTVAVISLDRLIAIEKALEYPRLVTIPRAKRVLVTIWIMCVLLPALQLSSLYIRVSAIGIVTSICLGVSTTSHLLIYKTVRYHQRTIQIQVLAVGKNTDGSLDNMLKFKKSALNSFIVFLVLFICYFPYFVVYAIYSQSTINGFLARGLTSTIVFVNSVVNPFLYCWRLREIREAVKQTRPKLWFLYICYCVFTEKKSTWVQPYGQSPEFPIQSFGGDLVWEIKRLIAIAKIEIGGPHELQKFQRSLANPWLVAGAAESQISPSSAIPGKEERDPTQVWIAATLPWKIAGFFFFLPRIGKLRKTF